VGQVCSVKEIISRLALILFLGHSAESAFQV